LTLALTWDALAPAYDFAEVWRAPVPEEFVILPTGVYHARLEQVEERGEWLYPIWRSIGGPRDRQRFRTAAWRLSERRSVSQLADMLKSLGVVPTQLETTDELIRALEGHVMDVAVMQEDDGLRLLNAKGAS
jgi:hypothetical protein